MRSRIPSTYWLLRCVLLLYFSVIVTCKMHLKHNFTVCIADFHSSLDSSAEDSRIHNLVLDNHKYYAASHQYDYYRQDISLNNHADGSGWKPHISWSKIPLVIKLLNPPYNYDWVLWIDSDAIFYNPNLNLFEVIKQNGVFSSKRGMSVAKFIFSGDLHNAINSGVMLIRNSKWTRSMLDEIWNIGENIEHFHNKRLGKGGDNAAFSVFLGGCNSTEKSLEILTKCHDATNLGSRDPELSKRIVQADEGIYQQMIQESILDHVAPLKSSEFNAYMKEEAKFILHIPTHKNNKLFLLEEALLEVKAKHGV